MIHTGYMAAIDYIRKPLGIRATPKEHDIDHAALKLREPLSQQLRLTCGSEAAQRQSLRYHANSEEVQAILSGSRARGAKAVLRHCDILAEFVHRAALRKRRGE